MPPRKRAAAKNQCKLSCCALTDADRARIKATLDDYYPGKWAELVSPGPACRCGKRRTPWQAAGGGIDDGRCPRHGQEDSDGTD